MDGFSYDAAGNLLSDGMHTYAMTAKTGFLIMTDSTALTPHTPMTLMGEEVFTTTSREFLYRCMIWPAMWSEINHRTAAKSTPVGDTWPSMAAARLTLTFPIG
jgi:hypothetical protein